MRIKAANLDEFNNACLNGYLYGELQGKRGLYVYVEIGQEQD